MLFTPEQRNPPKIRQSSDAFPVFILRGYKNTTPFWSMSLCFFVTFLNLDSHRYWCVLSLWHTQLMLFWAVTCKQRHDIPVSWSSSGKLQQIWSFTVLERRHWTQTALYLCRFLRNHVMTLLGFVFVFMKLDLVWFASVGTQTKRLLSNLSAR